MQTIAKLQFNSISILASVDNDNALHGLAAGMKMEMKIAKVIFLWHHPTHQHIRVEVAAVPVPVPLLPIITLSHSKRNHAKGILVAANCGRCCLSVFVTIYLPCFLSTLHWKYSLRCIYFGQFMRLKSCLHFEFVYCCSAVVCCLLLPILLNAACSICCIALLHVLFVCFIVI